MGWFSSLNENLGGNRFRAAHFTPSIHRMTDVQAVNALMERAIHPQVMHW
jgi:hypothetical protein